MLRSQAAGLGFPGLARQPALVAVQGAGFESRQVKLDERSRYARGTNGPVQSSWMNDPVSLRSRDERSRPVKLDERSRLTAFAGRTPVRPSDANGGQGSSGYRTGGLWFNVVDFYTDGIRIVVDTSFGSRDGHQHACR
jgi:hypothetical protein